MTVLLPVRTLTVPPDQDSWRERAPRVGGQSNMRPVGLVKGLGPTDQLKVRLGCQEREGFFDAGVDRAHALHVGGQDVGHVGADNDGGSAVAGDESFDGVGAGGAAPQHDGDGGHAGAHVFAEAVAGAHAPVVFAGQDAHVAAVPGQGDADDLAASRGVHR